MNVVLAGLLYGAIIGIGIFLLVVPGIIFACRLAFVTSIIEKCECFVRKCYVNAAQIILLAVAVGIDANE